MGKTEIVEIISVASFSDEGGPIRFHQSPLPPIFAPLSTSEAGHVKKDYDWLIRNQATLYLPPKMVKFVWKCYFHMFFSLL